MKALVFTLLLVLASPAVAQNCQPASAAVSWLEDYSRGLGNPWPSCYRIDYILGNGDPVWTCGGGLALWLPRSEQRSYSSYARVFAYGGSITRGFSFWPLWSLSCLCSRESCRVNSW